MITSKCIETLLLKQLPPEDRVHFMELYAALPFAVRQTCAEQLVVEPTLVPLFYSLLQNEESFAKQFIDELTFLQNESALMSAVSHT